MLKTYFFKTQKRAFLFIFFSLFLAVAAFYFMNALLYEFQNKLIANAKNISTSDIRIDSTKPPTPELLEEYQKITQSRYGFSHQIRFPSMAQTEDQQTSTLAFIKAVDNAYPIYGKVILTSQEYRTPQQGTCYIARELYERHNFKKGDLITVGKLKLQIIDYVEEQPDQNIMTPSAMMPSILINYHDAQATDLLQWGSRITYLTLLKAKNPNLAVQKIEKDSQTLTEHFSKENVQIRTWQDAQNMGRSIFEQVNIYFNLLTYGSIILSAIGLFLGIHSLQQRSAQEISLLYGMGVSRQQIFQTLFRTISQTAIIASLLGLLLGIAIDATIKKQMSADLTIASYSNTRTFFLIALSLFFSAILTLGLLFTYIKKYCERITANGYRWAPTALPKAKEILPFLMTIIITLYLFSAIQFAAWLAYLKLLGLLIILAILLFTFAFLLLYILRFIVAPLQRYPLFYLLNTEFFRGKNQTLPMFIALLFGSVFLLGIFNSFYALEENLSIDQQSQTHNLFFIDIQKDQTETLKKILDTLDSRNNLDLSPLITATLTHINQESVAALKDQAKKGNKTRKLNFLNRGYNLTYKNQLNSSEKIVAGKFWNEGETTPQISLEKDFAQTLDLNLGDVLSFDISGIRIEGTVTSIRTISWGAMKPNFFVVAPTAVLQTAPQTFIASCFMPQDQIKELQKQLSQNLTNISVINVEEIFKKLVLFFNKIRDILLISASLCLAAAILILLLSILANRESTSERIKTYTSIGLNQAQIKRLLFGEKLYFFIALWTSILSLTKIWNLFLEKYMETSLPLFTPTLAILTLILLTTLYPTPHKPTS